MAPACNIGSQRGRLRWAEPQRSLTKGLDVCNEVESEEDSLLSLATSSGTVVPSPGTARMRGGQKALVELQKTARLPSCGACGEGLSSSPISGGCRCSLDVVAELRREMSEMAMQAAQERRAQAAKIAKLEQEVLASERRSRESADNKEVDAIVAQFEKAGAKEDVDAIVAEFERAAAVMRGEKAPERPAHAALANIGARPGTGGAGPLPPPVHWKGAKHSGPSGPGGCSSLPVYSSTQLQHSGRPGTSKFPTDFFERLGLEGWAEADIHGGAVGQLTPTSPMSDFTPIPEAFRVIGREATDGNPSVGFPLLPSPYPASLGLGPVLAAIPNTAMRLPRHTAPAAMDATTLVLQNRRSPGVPTEPTAHADAPNMLMRMLPTEAEKLRLPGPLPEVSEGSEEIGRLLKSMAPGAMAAQEVDTPAPIAKEGMVGLDAEVAMKLYQRFGLNGCISFEKFVELHQTHLPRAEACTRLATAGPGGA